MSGILILFSEKLHKMFSNNSFTKIAFSCFYLIIFNYSIAIGQAQKDEPNKLIPLDTIQAIFGFEYEMKIFRPHHDSPVKYPIIVIADSNSLAAGSKIMDSVFILSYFDFPNYQELLHLDYGNPISDNRTYFLNKIHDRISNESINSVSIYLPRPKNCSTKNKKSYKIQFIFFKATVSVRPLGKNKLHVLNLMDCQGSHGINIFPHFFVIEEFIQKNFI